MCVVVAYFATGKPPLLPTLEEFPTHMITLLSSLVCLFLQIYLRLFLYGAVYKFFTRVKLTFGRLYGATFCGAPQIYLYRKPMLVALLTPFVVLSMINLTICFLLPAPIMKLLASMLLGAHIGACSGFFWESGLLIFKLRDDMTLIKDDGPKQIFFVPDGSDDK